MISVVIWYRSLQMPDPPPRRDQAQHGEAMKLADEFGDTGPAPVSVPVPSPAPAYDSAVEPAFEPDRAYGYEDGPDHGYEDGDSRQHDRGPRLGSDPGN